MIAIRAGVCWWGGGGWSGGRDFTSFGAFSTRLWRHDNADLGAMHEGYHASSRSRLGCPLRADERVSSKVDILSGYNLMVASGATRFVLGIDGGMARGGPTANARPRGPRLNAAAGGRGPCVD